MNEEVTIQVEETVGKGFVDGEKEAIDVPLRAEEKKRLNWENGLYLAPLTTVGNLVCQLFLLHSYFPIGLPSSSSAAVYPFLGVYSSARTLLCSRSPTPLDSGDA
jgi:hypothetical protein